MIQDRCVLGVTGGGHVHFGPGVKRFVEGSKERGWRVLGGLYGWGCIDTESIIDLGSLGQRELEKMEYVGASPIFSSRTKPRPADTWRVLKKYGITDVVAFGGDDTLSVNTGDVRKHGWPKTMDNNHGPQSAETDLSPGTYFDIGYPTAAQRAAEQTAAGLSNAQTNTSVHITVPFGRSQDFVALAASAYGGADFMLPGEREADFEDFYQRLQDSRLSNAVKYHCRPFAVVVIPEGVNKANAAGFFEEFAPKELLSFADKYVKKDVFGHPKLDPELIYLMARESVYNRAKDETGDRKIEKITGKVLTYTLRDGPGTDIDRIMGSEVAGKCIEMIENGENGCMATVRWDKENGCFTTGSVPIEDAVKERYVDGTGFFDYDKTWLFMPPFGQYAGNFMGKIPGRDELLFDAGKYIAATPKE